MKKITSRQRSYLIKKAHFLKPVVLVGKYGMTESLIQAVDEALKAHELIKIKFLDFKEEKNPLTDSIAGNTNSVFVSMIGNTGILYREHDDPQKRRFVLP